MMMLQSYSVPSTPAAAAASNPSSSSTHPHAPAQAPAHLQLQQWHTVSHSVPATPASAFETAQHPMQVQVQQQQQHYTPRPQMQMQMQMHMHMQSAASTPHSQPQPQPLDAMQHEVKELHHTMRQVQSSLQSLQQQGSGTAFAPSPPSSSPALPPRPPAGVSLGAPRTPATAASMHGRPLIAFQNSPSPPPPAAAAAIAAFSAPHSQPPSPSPSPPPAAKSIAIAASPLSAPGSPRNMNAGTLPPKHPLSVAHAAPAHTSAAAAAANTIPVLSSHTKPAMTANASSSTEQKSHANTMPSFSPSLPTIPSSPSHLSTTSSSFSSLSSSSSSSSQPSSPSSPPRAVNLSQSFDSVADESRGDSTPSVGHQLSQPAEHKNASNGNVPAAATATAATATPVTAAVGAAANTLPASSSSATANASHFLSPPVSSSSSTSPAASLTSALSPSASSHSPFALSSLSPDSKLALAANYGSQLAAEIEALIAENNALKQELEQHQKKELELGTDSDNREAIRQFNDFLRGEFQSANAAARSQSFTAQLTASPGAKQHADAAFQFSGQLAKDLATFQQLLQQQRKNSKMQCANFLQQIEECEAKIVTQSQMIQKLQPAATTLSSMKQEQLRLQQEKEELMLEKSQLETKVQRQTAQWDSMQKVVQQQTLQEKEKKEELESRLKELIAQLKEAKQKESEALKKSTQLANDLEQLKHVAEAAAAAASMRSSSSADDLLRSGSRSRAGSIPSSTVVSPLRSETTSAEPQKRTSLMEDLATAEDDTNSRNNTVMPEAATGMADVPSSSSSSALFSTFSSFLSNLTSRLQSDLQQLRDDEVTASQHRVSWLDQEAQYQLSRATFWENEKKRIEWMREEQEKERLALGEFHTLQQLVEQNTMLKSQLSSAHEKEQHLLTTLAHQSSSHSELDKLTQVVSDQDIELRHLRSQQRLHQSDIDERVRRARDEGFAAAERMAKNVPLAEHVLSIANTDAAAVATTADTASILTSIRALHADLLREMKSIPRSLRLSSSHHSADSSSSSSSCSPARSLLFIFLFLQTLFLFLWVAFQSTPQPVVDALLDSALLRHIMSSIAGLGGIGTGGNDTAAAGFNMMAADESLAANMQAKFFT